MRVSLYKNKRDAYVRQLGSASRCGRKGCGKCAQWRVILGHWDVQVYVCSDHMQWAVKLDMISENTGNRLGWEQGYGDSPNFRTLHSGTRVVPELGVITRTNFARPVGDEIDAHYPRKGVPFSERWGK